MIEGILLLAWTLAKILMITVPVIVTVAFFTLAERKVIGYMQARMGPNRVGSIFGFLPGIFQPFADVFKLLFKEIIVPANANKFLFFLAPVIALAPALAAWAVIPFNQRWILADIDAGLLYLLAMTSLAVYGIIIAGWASNSKYAFLGALRSAAQIVAYEIAMGFALVGVVIASGSLNVRKIVEAQAGNSGPFEWFWLPLFPLFIIYFIAAVAETNRAPFDVAEGESEIVAGFHVEYSGAAFSLFFLAEYANMILVSFLGALLFLGGWLSPFQGLGFLPAFLTAPSLAWLLAKSAIFAFFYLWLRATFPRYRYDQIMRLGWKVFIPITIVWIVVAACMVVFNVIEKGV